MTDTNNKEFIKQVAKASNIIRTAFSDLMCRKFFYYNIAAQFAMRATTPEECPTMGVAYVDKVHYLFFNPEFINLFNFKEISVIVEHEICHFTYDHVKEFNSDQSRTIFKDEEEARNYIRKKKEEQAVHRIKNIATDWSINCRLYNLPNIRTQVKTFKLEAAGGDKNAVIDEDKFKAHIAEKIKDGRMWFKDPNVTVDTMDDETIIESSCITHESGKDILKRSGYKGDLSQVKNYQGWKYYFDLLMSCPEIEQELENIREMDVHFGDEDGDGEGADANDKQQARERMLIEAAKNSNPHDIPGDLREHIKQLFEKYSKEEALPWYKILRRRINSAKRSIKKNDINSRNKYVPGQQIIPGYRLDPIKSVAIIWDDSGSCLDEETQGRFISECNSMIKSGCEVRIYYTDADVNHIQDCKDKVMKPSEYQINGGGGTHLDNGIKRAIADGYKIIIQLSDNYMDFRLSKKDLKGRKIINVCTTEAKQPAHYGPTIHVHRK